MSSVRSSESRIKACIDKIYKYNSDFLVSETKYVTKEFMTTAYNSRRFVGRTQLNSEGMKPSRWLAALVDSLTQAGKTNYTLNLLGKKIQYDIEDGINTLVLFVTQSNNKEVADQTLKRAMEHETLTRVIEPIRMHTTDTCHKIDTFKKPCMLVDFWNTKKTTPMKNFLRMYGSNFQSIIIVIDECDQGGIVGVKERIGFIQEVENLAHYSHIHVILVTATIANLSKSIYEIANDPRVELSPLTQRIVNEPVVEHHFVKPPPSYVGPSYFKDTPGVWKTLAFDSKTNPRPIGMSPREHRENTIMRAIAEMPQEAKTLSLVVTSSNLEEHNKLSNKLLQSGFNVVLLMNGSNFKDFTVNFISEEGKAPIIKTFRCPS